MQKVEGFVARNGLSDCSVSGGESSTPRDGMSSVFLLKAVHRRSDEVHSQRITRIEGMTARELQISVIRSIR
jgi:hypothetical protein